MGLSISWLTVTTAPSRTVYEIRRVIGWKSQIFHTRLLFSALGRGDPIRISGQAWQILKQVSGSRQWRFRDPKLHLFDRAADIGVASYGARAPLDFQLVIMEIRKMYKNNAIFAQFLSIFGPFLSFFCPHFSSGSNYSSQNAGTIANKFQLHTYFRFR